MNKEQLEAINIKTVKINDFVVSHEKANQELNGAAWRVQ